MTIQTDVLQPVLPALIKLFDIDATAITGSVYRFTDMTNSGSSVVWNGNTYSPYPIKIDGISSTSTGAPARPRLYVTAIDGFFSALMALHEDMTGAQLIYRETFSTYLGTSISMPPLYLTLSQPIVNDMTGIVFELKSSLDVEKKWLPARQMLRDGNLPFPGLGVNKSTN
jgi:lambda family phage minor tail protein L